MKTLLLATRNKGKVHDFQALLHDLDVHVLSLADVPDMPDVIEDGETFLDNARKKALEIHQATGLAVIADDSGICVDALHGAPGVHSARYAGEPCDDEANNRKLLAELEAFPEMRQRSGHYVCVLVYRDGEREWVEEGTWHGFITQTPRGTNGFGYDPLFALDAEDTLTSAQLDLEEKNRLSHRFQAMKKMKKRFATLPK